MEFHWIFSGILILCVIYLLKVLKKTSKRCYGCRERVLSFDTLEKRRRDALMAVLEREGIKSHRLEICSKCNRIYDEKWRLNDWDMTDRSCECGDMLKTPWDIDPPIQKKL